MKTNIVMIAILCVAQGSFAGNPPDDTLTRHWERAYQRELKQAVTMYEEGDPISKPQMYELARTYILRQVPPAVRVNFIEKVGTAGQPGPQDIVNSIKVYEEYGQTYGVYGWQGIVQTFIDKSGKQKQKTATLKDFADFLKANNVILQGVDLGPHGSDPAATATEKTLDSFFTQASQYIFGCIAKQVDYDPGKWVGARCARQEEMDKNPVRDVAYRQFNGKPIGFG